MKFITMLQRKVGGGFLTIFVILFFQLSLNAQSIPVYASVISDQNHVDLASNSIDGNLTTKAHIRASSGILIGVGAYSGELELQFPSTLPANTTSFVKIQSDDNLLPALFIIGKSKSTTFPNQKYHKNQKPEHYVQAFLYT